MAISFFMITAFCCIERRIPYRNFVKNPSMLTRSMLSKRFAYLFDFIYFFGFFLYSTARHRNKPKDLPRTKTFSATALITFFLQAGHGKKHVGVWKGRHGLSFSIARLAQLLDLLKKSTVDANISPKRIDERGLAANHFMNLMPNDLVLLDRGYPAWWLFALILSMNAQFCARISSKWKIVRALIASGKMHRITLLSPPTTSVNTTTHIGLNLIPMNLGLIRVDNQDKSQNLITSLTDKDKYPHYLFSDLYHSRWPVEEDYKTIASRIELENFSGKSVLSVYQDFHAKVLMKNIMSLVVLPVNEMLAAGTTSDRKYGHQVNFTHALAAGKDLMPLFFQRSIRKIRSTLDALMLLLIKTVEPIRTGRTFSRKHRVSNIKYFMGYKPIS